MQKVSKIGQLDGDCEKNWEAIVADNAAANKDMSYISQLNDFRGLNTFLKEFVLVRANLLKLSFVVDNEAIAFLASKGYKIDTIGAVAYAASLSAALKKSESINAKISIKRNAMVHKTEEVKQQQVTCEELVAKLNLALKGAYVKRDVLLCEYNAYKNSLK